MSGRLERGMDDDDAPVERRHRLRRREDAEAHDELETLKRRVRVTENVVATHHRWFEDLGVERMSEKQRESLPSVLEAVAIARVDQAAADKRTNRRVALVAAAAAVASALGPHLDNLITSHHF